MNNYQKQLKQINELSYKPTLLLHACCGVCSVYPLIYLGQYFKITVLFSNSNIYPYQEYLKRLEALEINLKNHPNINLIVDKYDNQEFMQELNELAKEKEGGQRCFLCYQKRMEKTFSYAQKHNYQYCTTIMSISNRKNADYINQIGEQLETKYPTVKFLHCDFKKGDGITLNEKLNKELNLYHQNYCGCIYSIK